MHWDALEEEEGLRNELRSQTAWPQVAPTNESRSRY